MKTYGVSADINGLISASGDAFFLTTGINDAASVLEAVCGVTAAISSDEDLSCVRASLKKMVLN